LVGFADRPSHEEVPRPGRGLVITIYRQPDDVRPQVDGSGPLSRMRGEIELTVRPAPGDKGTELVARPTASDGGSVERRRAVRAALRETKSILECGEVVEPSRQQHGQRYVPMLLERMAERRSPRATSPRT
jgi:hypothetical protein